MSNRVHPDGKGDVTPLRAKVATVAASAIEDTPLEKWREAEARYNAAVAAQIPKFLAGARTLLSASPVPPARPVTADEASTVADKSVRAPVLNGIDVLERDRFKPLEGLKIGLVTNHTGRNLAGKQAIDILKEAPNVKLVALFAPEHGIRGVLDDKVSDTVDEKTGCWIYSLARRDVGRSLSS
jgi:hypothetical protein